MPRRIPEATVARLPVYQRILEELLRSGTSTVSSELLAASARVNAAKVRKDLSLLGSFGTRGAGYDAAFLIEQIDRQLGLDRIWPVAIAGIGNLGRALARSRGFAARNFRIAALLDTDPAIIGERLDGVVVRHLDDLGDRHRGASGHRGHHHPGGSGAAGGRPHGGRPDQVHPQLRPPRARGAIRRPAALCRPQHRAPGDELLPSEGSRWSAHRPDPGHPLDRRDLAWQRLNVEASISRRPEPAVSALIEELRSRRALRWSGMRTGSDPHESHRLNHQGSHHLDEHREESAAHGDQAHLPRPDRRRCTCR